MFLLFLQKTEQELTLYPNKNGNISNLLEEAKQHLKVDGPLRLLGNNFVRKRTLAKYQSQSGVIIVMLKFYT